MEASKLRIGNIVDKGDGVIEPITAYELYQLDDWNKGSKVHTKFNHWKYVELTEKWLISFKFKSAGIFYYQLKAFTIEAGKLKTDPDNEVFIYQLIDRVLVIKYVHQLQNTYHSIIKEELILQENENQD